MLEADVNDVIMKIYVKVDTYLPEDQWYFDMPLAIRLCKPAITIEPMMADKCKDTGGKVCTACCNWADNGEPVLSSSPICKDIYKWIP
jgi:hypothetical protein